MDFGFNARTTELIATMRGFLVEDGEPAKARFEAELDALDDPWAWSTAPVLAELRTRARDLGLWNALTELPRWRTGESHAHPGRTQRPSDRARPPAMNCAAPDTGSMEVLGLFGTQEQEKNGSNRCRKRRLIRLHDGAECRFLGHDEYRTSIVRDGDITSSTGANGGPPAR